MKRITMMLVVLFFFLSVPFAAEAQKRSSKPKTVRVKSYKTKSGKKVKSYKRSKPTKKTTFFIHPVQEQAA